MEDQPNVTRRKPSRFRPLHSFSLRTLLVGVTLLAAVCAYVAHEAEIVRERDAMRLDLKNLGWVAAGDPKPLTFVRQWLGDEGY